MRIGITTSVIQRGRTGIAQYLFALVKAIAALPPKHEFSLFVLEEDLPLFKFVQSSMQLVPVEEKYRPPGADILWHQRELPRLAQKLNLDVIHTPSYRRLVAGGRCARVGTIHDLAPFHVAGKYDWKRMFYGRVVARYLASRQHAIIAISESTSRDVQRFFKVPNHRITVIPNGLDHSRFSPGDPGEAKRWAAERFGIRGPFFLYLARLEHPGKNHLRLIEAFESMKARGVGEWSLVFAGSDWHGAEVIHERIRNSMVGRSIKSLGFVPDADVAPLSRAADVFVYPSLFEGFGLPPLEAMACGCPVVSSDRGSLPEVMGDAAVLIDPENVVALSEQLARVAMSAVVRAEMRSRGLVQARKFDWGKSAEATLEVYSAAVEARAGSLRSASRQVSTVQV